MQTTNITLAPRTLVKCVDRMQWCIIRFGPSVVALSILLGCTRVEHRYYATFVSELDGQNELAISTFSAGAPEHLSGIAGAFETYETPGQLLFQIHVRNIEAPVGPNPHIQSINIHSFSYRLADAAPVVLLSEYPHEFWMQNDKRYDQKTFAAITHEPDSSIIVNVSLTLNGEKFVREGLMPAESDSELMWSVNIQ